MASQPLYDTACLITGEPVCKCLDKRDSTLVQYESKCKTLRKLFTDHAVYTNKYTIAYIHQLDSAKPLLDRLLGNQKEIGMFIGNFLGEDVGDTITDILTEHIQLAGEALTTLVKAKGIHKVMIKIQDNVTKFATAMAELTGRSSDKQKWYDKFFHHNKLVLNIASTHMKEMYDKENELYDGYYTHMLHFSDTMCSDLFS